MSENSVDHIAAARSWLEKAEALYDEVVALDVVEAAKFAVSLSAVHASVAIMAISVEAAS